MEEKDFESLVLEAIDTVPQNFKDILSNVDIVIEDLPNHYQMRKMRLRHGSMLLGLYEGVPQTKRGNYSNVLPDKITIFKLPLLRVGRTEEGVKEAVRKTVLHEIGHHFGMTDAELRKISY
jgi:predicted Zn-dependent protease with MMP-like domain